MGGIIESRSFDTMKKHSICFFKKYTLSLSISNTPYCVYAFLNPNDKSQFISVDDIDILLSYLIKKNYKVENEFTTLMCNNPKQIDKNLICYISKLI